MSCQVHYKYLAYVLFAYRDTLHVSTGFSSYKLMFGRGARGPVVALREVWTSEKKLPKTVVQHLVETRTRMETAQELMADHEKKAKMKSKRYYDQGAREDPIDIGEDVLVLMPAGPKGISASWEGPFRVLKKPSPLTYTISAPCRGKMGRTVHRNLLKRFIAEVNSVAVVTADGDLEGEGQLELGDQLITHQQENQTNRWDQAVEGNNLTQAQKQDLKKELEAFEETFSDKPGLTDKTIFSIPTGDSQPISLYPYRVPLKWRQKLDEEIDNLLKMGVIQPSTSAWTSPTVCVPKKDGTLRLCVDYRRLNSVTSDDVYPLPRVEDLIETVSRAAYISTLDLSKGYHQIPIRPEDIPKTAFATSRGKYEYTTMPFGLKGAPAAFQRTMDQLLGGLPFASAYIDDVVVFSQTWKDHLNHLRIVLTKLTEAGLTVKLGKCSFAKKNVSFLGHLVGQGRISPQESKTMAIKNFQKPRTKKDLRAFLGLAGYYRRFVPDFSATTACLSDLTAKKLPDILKWEDQHQKAFDHIKRQLAEGPTLTAPDPDKP